MKALLSFCFIILLVSVNSFGADEKNGFVSIEKLSSSGIIVTNIKSVGGYQQECILLTIDNQTEDSVKVWIEPGRRLVSDNPIYQDIFVVKEQLIVLLPKENRKTNVYGFCCQAHDRCPAKDSVFSIGFMAPEGWVKLSNLINTNDFPVPAIQNAIWCLSDNISLSSIADEDKNKIQLLIKTVAEIKGLPIPWYMLSYEKDTSMLFSSKPERLMGTINYYLKNNSLITVNIRSSNGLIISTLLRDKGQSPGSYSIPIDLNVKGWSHGKYDIYIYTDDATVISKSEFML